MATKISTFRFEETVVEALEALSALHKGIGKAEVIRRLLRRVKIDPQDTSPEADRARMAVAALQEQK